jgi:RND family efflux transporter MFP subunit
MESFGIRYLLPTLMIGVMSVSALGQIRKFEQTGHRGRVTKSFTEPIETNVVAASEAGVINVAQVKEGDQVSKGTPLAILNSDVLIQTRRRAVAQSQSTAIRDAATARVNLILSQKQNLESLFADGHVNQHEIFQKTQEYENAVAELKKAEDDLVLAKIEVDRIDAQIEQRIIKSPIDGFVTRIHKRLGEQVSNNEPQYATIVRLDELKAKFYLDLETIQSLQLGMSVQVYVGTQRESTIATIMFVSPVIDPDSGTGRVEVLIENPGYRIRSGTVCYFGAADKQSRSNQAQAPNRQSEIQR